MHININQSNNFWEKKFDTIMLLDTRDRTKIRFHFRFQPKNMSFTKNSFKAKICRRFGPNEIISIPKISFLPLEMFNITHWLQLYQICLKWHTLYLFLWTLPWLIQDDSATYKGSNAYIFNFEDAFHVFIKSCTLKSNGNFVVCNIRSVLKIVRKYF